MIRKFVNRERELKFLNDEKNKSKFVVIYGRRRVGKSELIKEFFKNKPSIYILAPEGEESIQLEYLTQEIAKYFNEIPPRIDSWSIFIDYLGKKLLENQIYISFDEFPFLIEKNKSILSYFQRLVDEYLIKSNSMIILSGSSISMMENEVLGYKSPIYGRRSGQIDLEPFNFNEVKKLFETSVENQIIAYSIFSGIPMYSSFYNSNKSIEENIASEILDKHSFLNKEPEFILRQELREPSKYKSILRAIGNGKTTPNEIIQFTKIPSNTLSKYLEQLIQLRLIKKEHPVTDSQNTKKSKYYLSDNLFKFWFKFIEPNQSEIENNFEEFLKYEIMPSLSEYTSFVFEDIAREFVVNMKSFGKVGRWWFKENEIDIVGLNKRENKILFGEVKWQENVDGKKILHKLQEKSKLVTWGEQNRTEEYILFAKSFKNKPHGVKCITLDDL